MAVNTQPNVGLILSLDAATYECQVIDLSFRPPGIGASTVTETACPDGVVGEPGTITSGALTGTAFTDSQISGLTWILASAYEANSDIDYVLTWFDELGITHAMEYTGTCRVASFQLDFSKPGINKHPLDLEVLTADLARPAA